MYREDIDNTIKKYMRSGLTRREAVIQLAIEKGIPLRPGLHIPPTIYDAFSELKREMKKETAKAVRMGSHGEEYERLIDRYSRIYGRSRYALEHKIRRVHVGGPKQGGSDKGTCRGGRSDLNYVAKAGLPNVKAL